MNSLSSFRVTDLKVRYGQIEAVRGISFEVSQGSSVALVGHNGAGKTSTLLAIGGCLPGHACSGRLNRSDGSSQEQSCMLGKTRLRGVTLVPERDKVFQLLTVHENLLAADHESASTVRVADVYGFFPRLADRRKTLAGNLSGGEQQMLAIGSALLGSPQLVLVDEPTLGLSVPVIESIRDKLFELRKELGLTLVVALAETTWVDAFADSALVLDRGELGSEPIATHPGVRERLEQLLTGSPATFQEPVSAPPVMTRQ